MEILSHIIYLAFSVGFTLFVGQTLFQNGRTFLFECFQSNKKADAVNRLFLVGFYLLNLAVVLIALRFSEQAHSLESLLKVTGTRAGGVALFMGFMHLNNLFWCNLIRRRRLERDASPQYSDARS